MVEFLLQLAALLALAVSPVVNANFTTFDHEYDGRVMAIEWTIYTVQLLVEEQKDDWLTKQYNATETAVLKAEKAGNVTATVALQALNDFYAVADTKYENFGKAAAAKIRSNPPDVSVVSIVAPEAWCDFIFGLMFEVATESGNAELKTLLETRQKKAEDAITKRVSPKEVNDLVVPLYGEGNDIYPTFSKELGFKIEAFATKWDDEITSAVIKKSTVAPTTKADGSSSETTTAPAVKSSAARNVVASIVALVATLMMSIW